MSRVLIVVRQPHQAVKLLEALGADNVDVLPLTARFGGNAYDMILMACGPLTEGPETAALEEIKTCVANGGKIIWGNR